eukprot:4830081-Pyramimonas_sp.AAC.1
MRPSISTSPMFEHAPCETFIVISRRPGHGSPRAQFRGTAVCGDVGVRGRTIPGGQRAGLEPQAFFS